jgi:hypothetical protein
MAALFALWLAPALAANEIAAPEYKVKAAFLYNFAKLTEWPSNTFASAQSPFIIGVLGSDPFGKTLDEVVAGRKVHDHPIFLKRFESRRDATNCHLLFVSASERSRNPAILSKLKNQPVLTIGETEGFARQGGVIELVKGEENIRFEINPEAAERSQLKLSSKLLRLGTIVLPMRALSLPANPSHSSSNAPVP